LRVIDEALTTLDGLGPEAWERDAIDAAIRGMEESLGLKPRKFIPVLYVATMGRRHGIPLFESLVILGRERSLHRLRAARGRLE
jgi:glutamyl-tRNA synthetase